MMKKNILWLFAVLFALVCSTPLLSSCSKDKDENWETKGEAIVGAINEFLHEMQEKS